MSKNLIPAVAEMLGLKLREKFRIDRYDEVYFFTEENLEVNKAYPQIYHYLHRLMCWKH